MEFTSLVLFLFTYLLKPQEWFRWMADLRPVQVAMALGILGLFSRDRSFRVKDILRTPHDYMVFIYVGWIVFVAQDHYEMFKSFQVHLVTYIVTVHALTNVARMKNLLGWWAGMLILVSALALLTMVGFDPLDSQSLTNYHFKGRLCLNISTYNNPNTLAHTIVPAAGMVFFLLFWKRLAGKVWSMILVLPIVCIWFTQSKGAFLSLFSTFTTAMTFGRKKWVQIVVLSVAATSGISAVFLLPRMTELKHAKTDEAIQGRIAALEFGYKSMQNNTFGIGPGTFMPKFFKEHGYYKAAHNSYNQNGAETGKTGLWLFIAVMYTCARSLIQARTGNDDEERVRRALFSMLMSYVVSSWMVDFGYRVSFFMMVGATGAFHRHISGITAQIEAEIDKENAEGVLSPVARRAQAERAAKAEAVLSVPLLRPGASGPVTAAVSVSADEPQPAVRPQAGRLVGKIEEPEEEPERPRSLKWNRFGLIDIAICFVLLEAVQRFWMHLIKTM